MLLKRTCSAPKNKCHFTSLRPPPAPKTTTSLHVQRSTTFLFGQGDHSGDVRLYFNFIITSRGFDVGQFANVGLWLSQIHRLPWWTTISLCACPVRSQKLSMFSVWTHAVGRFFWRRGIRRSFRLDLGGFLSLYPVALYTTRFSSLTAL